MVKAIAAQAPSGAMRITTATSLNTTIERDFGKRQDRLADLADHRQRDPEQNGDQQDLKHRPVGQGGQDGGRHDIEDEAGDGGFFGLRGVAGDRARIERRGIDVHPRTRLDDVGDDQADHQREARDREEIGHRPAGDPADFGNLGQCPDARHDGQKDDRRDDHLDQADEQLGYPFELGTERRPDDADRHAERDSDQHLNVELPDQPAFRPGGCRRGRVQ